MYNLQERFYKNLEVLFANHPSLITPSFEKKIKRSVGVLHHGYLLGACKEAVALVDKNQGKIQNNLFDAIMDIYSKRRNQYQAKFFLLQCFENALRSTMATTFASAFNRSKDDWFLRFSNDYRYVIGKIDSIICLRNKKLKEPIYKENCTTFDIFDLFSLGDLEEILEKYYYPHFEWIFKEEKIYKGQILPVFGTKQHAIDTITRIRSARNEIFHNKPTRIKFQKDVEILLLRLGYNLSKASKSINLQGFLHLKFGEEVPSKDI
ncbi:Abi family protein [Helicobacter suis]|uniref:Abi family protein n=1 Tax=Helicobacter suis TaxID=104628 RepID=UPI0013D1D704|nr:Abi family protein [Helicobacter suis]